MYSIDTQLDKKEDKSSIRRYEETQSHYEANNKCEHPNETMKLLIERASCRDFSNKKISSQVLQLILEAGIHAPTAGNLQPYSVIKIEDDKTKQKLAKMCWQDFISDAPVLLLFCVDWHRIERWASLKVAPFTATSSFRHFWVSFQDVVICAQNICTAADSMGLGSVYIGSIIEHITAIKDMFKLPKGVFPVVLLCIGYPKTKPQPRKKLGVDVIVHSERYREIGDQELIDAFNEKYHEEFEISKGYSIGTKFEITKKLLEKISEVCREVHGEEFAKKCVDQIKENGYINTAQYYFGLHYRANAMPIGNKNFLKLMEEFGFNWFKKYHLIEDKEP